MKITKSTMKNTISTAVLLVALFVTTLQAQAVEPVTSPVALTLLGKVENKPVVKLALDLEGNKDAYELNITDVYGVSLYKEYIKGESFEKKYMLGDNEDEGDFIFELTNIRTKKITTYKVSQKSETTRNVVIEKL